MTQDPKYSEMVFRFLTRWEFVKNSGSLNLQDKILVDFDSDGSYIQAAKLMALGGIQIGPVSLASTQKMDNMGILFAKANILTFLEKNHQEKNPLKIGVDVIPDEEVELYAPYIIPENVVKASNVIAQVYNNNQKNVEESALETKIIDFLTLNGDHIVNTLGK